MIEIALNQVRYGVKPMEDGGKTITLFHEPSMTVYAVPFTEETVKELIGLLQKDNEEQRQELEEKLREARMKEAGIEIPGGPVPGMNGEPQQQ